MKRIVLIAHDTKRETMIRWLRSWRGELSKTALYVAGPFGRKPVRDLGLTVHPVVSGSDGENGALRRMIEEGRVELIIFFWEPSFRMYDGIDPGAVLAMAEQYDVPTALNPWTADYFFSLVLGRVRRTPRRMAV